MWKQEVHKLLETNQITFEINNSISVFETIFLPQSSLYLHLIDLQYFQQNQLPVSYFQAISDKINIQNQRVIHLWEDVYLSKTALVNSRILAILGIFTRLHARHCFIERLDKPTADNFLEINHLQGSVKAKFKYGLFLKPQYVEKFMSKSKWLVEMPTTEFDIENNLTQATKPQLIAIATFSGGRMMKIGERIDTRSYELIRFASLQGYVVVGGMDKLLKAFSEEHHPDDIMSYADRDWSDGRSYFKLGFTKIGNSLPQPFHLNLSTLKRLSFSEKTEDIHLKIFNAGSIKFIKKITKSLLLKQ